MRCQISNGTWSLLLLPMLAAAQDPASRFETFDRYDATQYSVEVEGLEGVATGGYQHVAL